MSLVAYDASTDSENDNTDDEMDDDNQAVAEIITDAPALPPPTTSKQFNLPAPKHKIESNYVEIDKINVNFRLPEPVAVHKSAIIEEEDDEFLKKKEIPTLKPPKAPVRITIPSLAEFKDVDEYAKPNAGATIKPAEKTNKLCGLLSLLPKPNTEKVFDNGKRSDVPTKSMSSKPTMPLIPYSLMGHKKSDAHSYETKNKNAATKTGKTNVVGSYSDSDSEDGDTPDFFSLNKEDELPVVSETEIKAMVAKKQLKLAQTSAKFDELTKPVTEASGPIEASEIHDGYYDSSNSHGLEAEAINHLLGSSAKRKRNQEELMNIVEISHEQVMPDRNLWIRNALAQSTQNVPKGKLNDEELIPGSKRKHQITYLAHQAKTNESELQAMWANNRQTRRQTQSKYGF